TRRKRRVGVGACSKPVISLCIKIKFSFNKLQPGFKSKVKIFIQAQFTDKARAETVCGFALHKIFLAIHPEFGVQNQFVIEIVACEIKAIAEFLVIKSFKVVHPVLIAEKLRTAERGN